MKEKMRPFETNYECCHRKIVSEPPPPTAKNIILLVPEVDMNIISKVAGASSNTHAKEKVRDEKAQFPNATAFSMPVLRKVLFLANILNQHHLV